MVLRIEMDLICCTVICIEESIICGCEVLTDKIRDKVGDLFPVFDPFRDVISLVVIYYCHNEIDIACFQLIIGVDPVFIEQCQRFGKGRVYIPYRSVGGKP